jgi:hypothetical protein
MATTVDARTKRIITAAKERAAKVARERDKALQRRKKALETEMPAEALALEAPRVTKGHLIAEGDSWFDYPGVDILRALEDDFAYDVESVAHSGDRIEMMAGPRSTDEVLGRDREGDPQRSHAEGDSPLRWRKRHRGQRARDVVESRRLASGGAEQHRPWCDRRARARCVRPHHRGRDRVVRAEARAARAGPHARLRLCRSDGRGFLGGWWLLPGPWLEPGFIDKGFDRLADRQPLMNALIDRFNAMVQGVASLSAFAHVKYVDLRPVLPNAPNHKRFWANELHPTDRGFRAVAAEFVKALP